MSETKQELIVRVHMGHRKPVKSWNLIVGHGKSWKIKVCVVRKLL